jgi:GNAT superfamily N-acetyltransferase
MKVEPLSDPLEGYPFQGMTFPAYVPVLLSSGGAGTPFLALGARDDAGEPAGLLLARRDEPAELLSVFTRRDLRRSGVASRLLAAAETALAAEGTHALGLTFERGRPGRGALENLLCRAGYPPFARTALMCRLHGPDKISRAPWLRRLSIPAAFELFPWTDLRAAERSALEERFHRGEIPANLDPFQGERWFEPGNSIGLRFRGEVVAWQVNHRPIPGLLRYTYTYAREDLQGYGLAVALVAESIRRHMDGPLVREAPEATFKIPVEYEAMTRFVEKHWSGCADEINEIVRCAKTLTSNAG